MHLINVFSTLHLFVILLPFVIGQNYESEYELRGLGNRKRRPNSSGGPCGRNSQNDEDDGKFLGLAYVNVENTYNCGTGHHYTSSTGGQNGGLFSGGGHRPHRPFGNHGSNQNNGGSGHQDDQNGVQNDGVSTNNGGGGGGGGLFGNKPNRPFAGLVSSLGSSLGSAFSNTGQNDEGPGAAFGGLVSSVVSNIGTVVSNNNPFQSGSNPFNQQSTPVEDVPNDPAPVYEQDKLAFFSNQLFTHHYKPTNQNNQQNQQNNQQNQQNNQQNQQNNQNSGLFFGLFDGSIINSYFNKPGNPQYTTHRPTIRPQGEYVINNNFVATQTTSRPALQRPTTTSFEEIKPVHEDYDQITEAYSLHKPQLTPYANLRPGKYISAYNPLNGQYDINRIDNIKPHKVAKKINREFDKFLDLFF